MLKQIQPGPVRRAGGVVLAGVVILLGAGVAYAATAPASGGAAHVREYQLGMKVEWSGDSPSHGRVRRLAVAMCQSPNKATSVNFKTMAVETIVTPLRDDRVRIATTIFDGAGHELAKPVLIGALGEPLRVSVGRADSTPRYTVDITPIAGCPARKAASHNPT
jgi:hypothetical protein